MLYLTRREHFNGAHRLYNQQWSDEQNLAVFGKCANKNWHGHNFDLFVTIKGMPDPATGFVMNAHHLGQIIKTHVLDRLDHKNLNIDVPELQGVMPSIENIAVQIWRWMVPHIQGCELHCVKLVETENIYIEYFGG